MVKHHHAAVMPLTKTLYGRFQNISAYGWLVMFQRFAHCPTKMICVTPACSLCPKYTRPYTPHIEHGICHFDCNCMDLSDCISLPWTSWTSSHTYRGTPLYVVCMTILRSKNTSDLMFGLNGWPSNCMFWFYVSFRYQILRFSMPSPPSNVGFA